MSLYLLGYAAEMVIGSAYCKNLGFGLTDPIDDRQLGRMLTAGRERSNVDDRSHPIDGLARLLVETKGVLSPPAYDKKFALLIINRADKICQYLGPKLRYRAIEASEADVLAVRASSEWFLRISHKL